MAIRKVVIRQMSLYLATMDAPIYSAIILSGVEKNKELILVFATVVSKLLLIFLEYREAKRKLRLAIAAEKAE